MIGLLLRWAFRLGMAGVFARSLRSRRAGAARATGGDAAVPTWARRVPHVSGRRVLRVVRVTGHTLGAVVLGALGVVAMVAFATLVLTGAPTFLTVAVGTVLVLTLLGTGLQVRAVLRAGRSQLPTVL